MRREMPEIAPSRGVAGGRGAGTLRESAMLADAALAAVSSATANVAVPPTAPVAKVVAPVADRAVPRAGTLPLDINRVSEHWDEIVEAVRRAGRAIVASALGEAAPTAVTAAGVVTIEVTGEALVQAIENGADVILTAMRERFTGVARVAVRGVGEERPSKRLTADDVIANRVAMLRKRDPILDAAVAALDLKLVD
jgi:hypothetical protein